MIKQTTINEILETAQIEEVIGEFVSLKKRGVNYVALCPFHSEKTPSFTVSPSKGIYKCFGCGEAGNVVNFLMVHEHYNYPEALTYLAEKYNIEIEDTKQTPEEKLQQEHKESLYIVNNFAKKYFIRQLFESEEGRNVGLPYFKERGYREHLIKKFNLGYAPDEFNDFTQAAVNNQYKKEYLKEVGLTSTKNNKEFDFFRGRVIFPIHNLSGKVIAFAGRTLKDNSKLPKYLNTPESDIYKKRQSVYGLYHAKKAIRRKRECFMVEGYTDVLSLHQAGVEHVVASAGTSLTREQIRIIGRYAEQLTIIFDADEAGGQAALRGIDLILEQGMNVKVLMLPEGHDPDSYVNEVGKKDFLNYVEDQKEDFVLFKTNLLLQEVEDDPTGKADAIQEVVRTIAKIPDHIKRSLIIKECSDLLELEEEVLVSELNKIKRKEHRKNLKKQERQARQEARQLKESSSPDAKARQPQGYATSMEQQEKDLVRVILEFGDKPIEENLTVLDYIMEELPDIELNNVKCQQFFEEVRNNYKQGRILKEKHFLHHEDKTLRRLAIDITTSPHSLSKNWYEKHDIIVKDKESFYKKDVYRVVAHLKLRKVQKDIEQIKEDLKQSDESQQETLLKEFQQLQTLQRKICDFLGTVVIQ